MNTATRRFLAALSSIGMGMAASSDGLAQGAAQGSVGAAVSAAHSIGAAKLIIGDVTTTQAFYEQMFGMKEVRRYSDPAVYEEPIMGFDSGARLALFSPKAEAALKKSLYPVALIYTPEFDALTKRLEDAKHPLQRLPAAQTGPFRIAIARDPSGNAIEILAREGKAEVGGAKLIVDDRQKAEEFYAQIFNVKPVQRYKSPAYDEVLMGFGEGAFLALFQPLSETPLPKSKFAVVAIYTSEFDAVLKRVTERGLGFRPVKSSTAELRIIIAQDPAGNAVEIISR